MEQNTTQVHHVKAEDLIQKILEGVDNKIEALESRLNNRKPPEYITRQEASKILGVSLVSLHKWCEKGILKPYRISNRVRFKRSEIEDTLETSR